MNMLLPDKFARISGAKVKIVVHDIAPLSEDYSLTPILLSVLRDLARDTDIIIEHCDDVLSEVSLSERRIEDALSKADADVLVFGSYMATHSNFQPMIHIICTYGRPMEQSASLPEGMDLNQAVEEGDAILQMPRHTLLREVLPVMSLETLSFQNSLAEEIFHIAQFIQGIKLYKDGKFEETALLVNTILASLGVSEQWPDYWVPFSYLHMLGGLAYLRMGNNQAAAYTLSDAISRSTPAKMRVQRCAEQILSVLLQPQEEGAPQEEVHENGSEPAPESNEPAQK